MSLKLELSGCICCVQTAGLPCNRCELFAYVVLCLMDTDCLLYCVYMMPASVV